MGCLLARTSKMKNPFTKKIQECCNPRSEFQTLSFM